jgi:hypothetical protein
MKQRRLYALGLVVAVGVLLTSVPAFGSRAVPTVTITTQAGATLPTAAYRFDGALDRTTNRIYFLGWRLADNTTDGSIWYYDIAAHTYTDTGVDMRVPISNYQVAVLTDSHGTAFYTFGGRDNNGAIIQAVQAFYPATNQTALFNLDKWPGTTPSACVSLPGMGVAVVQNKAYVLGGESFSSSVPACVDDNSTQTWTFDPMAAPGTKWTQGPDLNLARGYITAAVLQGTIYAIGGNQNIAGTLFAVATVEKWKPGQAAWNDAGVADLPQGCDESQAFAFTTGPLARGIALMGCGQWPNAIPDTYFYSQTANTWSDVGALIQARRNHAGELIGKNMYLFGGVDGTGAIILDSSEIGHGAPLSSPRSLGWTSPRGVTGGKPLNN